MRRSAGGGVPLSSRLGALLVAMVMPVGQARASSSGAGPALTNESVVRMVMQGTPEKTILSRIASEPCDFDLSPETTVELRRAGVSEPILEAMRRRQAEAAPPPPTPLAAEPAKGTLEVRFSADPAAKDAAGQSAIALVSLPRGMARRGGMEVGQVTDLALAIFCTTPDHVPDHWDARSPLKVDAPRHEMLLFRPGSGQATLRGFKVLYLQHDASYAIPMAEGTHDIQVAVAGQQAGSRSWKILSTDGARVSIRHDGSDALLVTARSRVLGGSMTGYRVDAQWKVAAVKTP